MSSNNETKELLDFIAASPTCFQAVKNITDRLESEGYTRLSETGEWNLVPRREVLCHPQSVIRHRIQDPGKRHKMLHDLRRALRFAVVPDKGECRVGHSRILYKDQRRKVRRNDLPLVDRPSAVRRGTRHIPR